MKKKICSLLSIMFMLFSAVFVTACGNRYSKIEFEILYAFEENAEVWLDATNGISLNYDNPELVREEPVDEGEDDDEDVDSLIFENGIANLYLKVVIKNVKAKHIDTITVSATSLNGLNFSTRQVAQNQIFALPVTGNVNTTLKFYENNSRKSHSVSLSIYRSLECIEVDTEIKPAMQLEGSLNLLQLNNLTYQPVNLTNQTGVKYEIASIGYYNEYNEYVPMKNAEEAQRYVEIENGVLRVVNDSFFGSTAYIVRVNAISLFHDGSVEEDDVIDAEFDVYLVEVPNVSPIVKFESAEGKTVDVVEIYENGGDKYSTSTIYTSSDNLNSIYKDGKKTIDGTLQYVLAVYVKNGNSYERYEFNSEKHQSGINGLKIVDLGAGLYKLSIVNRNLLNNIVKIAYVIDGLDFSASQDINASTEFSVTKGLLPTCITVNDTLDLTGGTQTATILGTTDDNYLGLPLKLSANPKDSDLRKIYLQDDENGLIITDGKHTLSENAITTGQTIYVKFKDNVTSSKTLTIKTLKVPETYNGEEVDKNDYEYITIKYNFEKLVTANRMSFVVSKDKDAAEIENSVVLDARTGGRVYVKVYYTGSSLNTSTVKLKSSNAAVLFANNSQEIYFNDSSITEETSDTEGNEKYTIYSIPIIASNGAYSTDLTVIAGDETFSIEETIKASTVYLMGDALEGIQIVTSSSNVRQFTAEEIVNDAFNFAMANQEFAIFNVLDGNNRNDTIANIKITLDTPDGAEGAFNVVRNEIVAEEISNSSFTITTNTFNKTGIFKLTISYYELNEENGLIELSEIEKEVQIAVFEAIGDIYATSSKNTIGYVNPFFEETSVAEINFNSYTSIYGTPANSVKFLKDAVVGEIAHASQIQIGINNFSTIKNTSAFSIKYVSGSVEIDLLEENNTVLAVEDVDYLQGKIVVQVTDKIESLKQITLIIKALRFGLESNVLKTITLDIAKIETAERIAVSGNNFVQTADEQNELRLSFQTVKDGGYAENEFKAEVQFKTPTPAENTLRFDKIQNALTYVLYQYDLDEEGRIIETIDENGQKEAALYRISNDFLTITFGEDGVVKVRANKDNGGGLFKLVLATKDSYKLNTNPNAITLKDKDFAKTREIIIRVEDGTKNARYLIETEEDLMAINYDLKAHYQLAANIDIETDILPLGVLEGEVYEFEGSLIGDLQSSIGDDHFVTNKYTIKYTVRNTAHSSEFGTLAGLFARIKEGAKISNINLDVTFANKFKSEDPNGLKIGALAGVNNGTIENVNVKINTTDISLSLDKANETDKVSVALDFGGIVGVNNGKIEGSKVETQNKLSIVSGAEINHNIGFITGTNFGTISGSYVGKESLDNYIFDIIANLEVLNQATGQLGSEYNIGAVAGTSSGIVQNLLAGGQIIIKQTSEAKQSGALGGLVGCSLSGGSITTSSVMSMDVKSYVQGVDVAGIVGKAYETTINYVKFISVETKFADFAPKGIIGQVIGKNLVAGIVTNSVGGSILNSSVENFVDTIVDEEKQTETTFYTLQSGAAIAGIAAQSSGTNVENSFVSANISSTGTIVLTANVSQSKTYFIGLVEGTVNSEAVKPTYYFVNGKLNDIEIDITPYMITFAANESTENWTNVYIDNKDGTYTKADAYLEEQAGNYVKFSQVQWNAEHSVVDFEIAQYYNVIVLNGVEINLPFLMFGEEKLMIVEPQAITAHLNTTYITNANSVHIKEFNYADYQITESVIVNFFENKGDEANSHNLVNTSADEANPNGLINIDLLPEDAQGGYTFEILGTGYKYAYINNHKQLVITAISGQTPIIIRCYSAFKPEVQVYFAVYSQFGVSHLKLSASSIVESGLEDYEYETSVYTGQNNKIISLLAENKYQGSSCSSIFDNYTAKQYLYVEYVSDKADSKLLIDTSAYNNITVRIKDGEKIEENYAELITFTLFLKSDYFVTYASSNVEIETISVLVHLYNSATDLSIEGSDKEISTHDDISFKVYLTTDYVDKDEFPTGKTIVVEEAVINLSGDFVVQNNENADGIRILFRYEDEFEGQIQELLRTNNKNYFTELFSENIQVLKSLYIDEITKKTIGYIYDISLELNDNQAARYITENIQYEIVVVATSNPDCSDSLSVLLKPTSVSTIRVENYAVKTLNLNTAYTNIVTNNDIETSIIQPGGLGNVMLIYLEPTYSNVVSVKISTSSLFVPSLNKDVQMKFTQLVYDGRRGGKFTTLYGGAVSSQVGDTLELKPEHLVSSIDENGIRQYNGIICLYIQVEDFSGLEGTLTATLEVETNNGKIITRTRDLLTTYLPGTQVIFNEERRVMHNDTDGYLIQQGTANNEVKIKIQGYQFNSNPNLEFSWELPTKFEDGQNKIVGNFEYVDGNTQKITDGTKVYLIGDYISYSLLNNYKDVIYNEKDDSYTISLKLNVAEDIPASFAMSATLSLATKDGQLFTSENEDNKIVFFPTNYILNSVGIANLSNGRKNVAIDKTQLVELQFTTDNQYNDLTDSIYQDLVNYANMVDANNGVSGVKLASLFTYYKNGAKISFAENELHPEFEVNLVNDKMISILGVSSFIGLINLDFDFGYNAMDNGKFELKFGSGYENTQAMNTSFTLEIYANSKDKLLPIYSADEIYNSATGSWKLVEGFNYILMNDITLENVVPITTAIGSFDGNNRVISIKSFAVNPSSSEFGLFAHIGTYSYKDDATAQTVTEQTILKNVIVDYSKFEGTLALNNNEGSALTIGGLVATNNGGLIYNCDVMNLNASIDKTVDIIVSSTANVTFGGLVGVNNGVITNSRVGRDSYTRITATKTTESSIVKSAGGLSFNIFNKANDIDTVVNQFQVVAAGFVGKNLGTIATSYVTRTNLTNYSTNETLNITAGFVGENSGEISYSYAKADEKTINVKNVYAIGYVVENTGNGVVSGFVYNNTGSISNAYANIELQTKSAYISGFVYNNAGTITETYAACTMNSGIVDNYAEQPFIGLDNTGTLLSTGTIDNSYYLMRSEIDTPYYQDDKDVAQGLNKENFQNSEYLLGFAFVLSNSKAEREQGIWSYYTLNSDKRVLPELMNANIVSHSYRYVVDEKADEIRFTNAISYAEGSVNNPYIISNVKEFNEVFAENNSTTRSGYIRFINNIDFKNDETAIKTRTNYTLGSTTASTKTSIEGNGMTISGIYLDVGEAVVNEIGLFAQIKNTYIKNLNLEFATPSTDGQFSTTTVTYSGGLAGKIENSVLLNIKLNGSNTTLTGSNFVGGLAGLISGKSLVYGIETNLNVKASSAESYLYYSDQEYQALNKKLTTHLDYNDYIKKLSYAGGIAGVLDLEDRTNVEYNVQYIDVRGDQMSAKIVENNQEANILAEYAGGIAGYANDKTNSFKLRYFVGENELIRGNTAVGGLYGVAMGKIVASQVTADEKIQFTYDTNIGEYIIGLQAEEKNNKLDKENVGNLNLLESYNYAGGLIGLGLNANIRASYSKASIKSGIHVGGLVGLSVAGLTTYSYAIPYINVNSDMKNVGGLFGSVYGLSNKYIARNSEIDEFETLLEHKLAITSDLYTDIQFTYSTLVTEIENLEVVENQVLDYVVANYKDDSRTYITSSSSSNLTYVYAGVVKYGQNGQESIVKNQTKDTSNASVMDLYKLYNTEDSAHSIYFQEVFSGWSVVKYWSLKEEKYFPLLNNEAVDNFIPIASEADLALIRANPEGKFKVINSFPISQTTANWIIGGTTPFSGVLLGEMENNKESRPVITINGLVPDSLDSAGFFRATKNATISNIEFVWVSSEHNASIDTKNVPRLTTISGLTCDDSGSLISNVEVRVTEGKGFINEDATISGFGGLVGTSVNTNILGSTFIGKVKAKLSSTVGDVYVGALVARGETVVNDNPTIDEKTGSDAAVINNSYVGARGAVGQNNVKYAQTSLEFEADDSSAVYVGGVIGYAENVSMSAILLGGNSYEPDYRYINIALKLNDVSKNAYIGGLVGFATDGMIANSTVQTNLTIVGKTVNSEGNNQEVGSSLMVGGLAAHYDMSSQNSFSSGIRGCSSLVNINTSMDSGETQKLELDKLTQFIVSTGVGELSGLASIQQCLFKGEVNTEGSEITNVYAGGAAAVTHSDTGFVEIQEVITDAVLNIGTSATSKLYVGGLVGKTKSAQISYSASWGRIVPITSASAPYIYAGGLIGLVEEEALINNTYTISSIIADSISSERIQDLNIGALIGSIKQTANVVTTDVFYSSDYALFADENYIDNNPIGYNLSATSMIYGNVWHKNLKTEDNVENLIWNTISSGANSLVRLPYLTALEQKLKDFNILFKDKGVTYYDYVEGTALRPELIIDGKGSHTFAEQYTYYMLDMNIDKLPQFNGTLNGMLIAPDKLFEANQLSVVEADEAKGIDTTYQGIIAAVLKHSVISNLKVKFEDQAIAFSNIGGLIAGINNGVIFNSTVQGNAISIVGSATGVGLIAGQNNGLVSFCYSSAEVLETTISTSGIVYTNASKLLSNYFTGYIETSNEIIVAGIVAVFSGENNYCYNNYMAGTIKGGVGYSAFSATDFGEIIDESNIGYGSNNFIDSYSDIGFSGDNYLIKDHNNGKDLEINAVISVTTAELMSNSSDATLSGKWYFVFKEDWNGVALKENADSFGYNYNYPIYRFNKHKQLASGIPLEETVVEEWLYHTYTGKGGNGEVGDLTIRYTNFESAYYNDAIKIPHLGVLTSIQALIGEDRNYAIIYDLDAEESVWTSVGSIGKVNGFKNAFELKTDDNGNVLEQKGFQGLIISNKYFAYNKDELCKIENFKNQGLFNNVANAYIADFKLGNFIDLEQSGALGVSTLTDGVVEINNIQFDSEQLAEIAGKSAEDNFYGALFGSVQGDLYVNKIVTGLYKNNYLDKIFVVLSGNQETTVGFVAGYSSGNIIINADVEIFAKFSGNKYAGGIVGKLDGGSVVLSDSAIINIVANSDVTTTGMLGGVVGVVSTKAEISGGNINFVRIGTGDKIEFNANSFGGIVGEVKAEISINKTNLSTKVANATVAIWGNSKTNRYYGLVAANVNALLKVGLETQCSISKIKTFAVHSDDNGANYDETEETNGVGTYIGKTTEDVYLNVQLPQPQTQEPVMSIVADKVVNLGGIIGYYGGGKVIVVNSNHPVITVQGSINVGGLFGYSGVISTNIITPNIDLDVTMRSYIVKLFEGKTFARITVGGINVNEGQHLKNFGGLIGFWNGGIAIAEEGDNLQNGVINSLVESITNSNNIDISTGGTVYNVGGIAGKINISQDISLPLFNSGSFKETVNNTFGDIEIISAVTTMGKHLQVVKLSNVGGIFGLVEANADITLNNMRNDGTIKGYQNVGGLVGYVASSGDNTYKINITSEAIEFKTADGSNIIIARYKDGAIVLDNAEIKQDIELEKYLTKGAVYGVINVGGAVGFAGKNVTISQIVISANVYGNTSVGGLIGYVQDAALISNYLVYDTNKTAYDETDDFGLVKGIYYAYVSEPVTIQGQKEPKQKVATFIPTSVGGLTGTAERAVLKGNVVDGIKITSSQEGESSESIVVSTYQNYISQLTINDTGAGNAFTNNNEIYSLDKLAEMNGGQTAFENIKTGFGGFAGTINSATIINGVDNNYIHNIDINAQLGVNTGTYYGVYHFEKQQTEGDDHLTFSAPKLYSKNGIKVDGAYNIGGVVGYIEGSHAFTNYNISNKNLEGSASITLQSRQTGMYVGGIIGKTISNSISGITINATDANVKVIINTNRSYYIGGVIGRAETSGGTITLSIFEGEWTEKDGEPVKPNMSVASGDYTTNFGGLIGLLKVGKVAGGTGVTVNGKHYYPFTINTIENSNYFDGKSLQNTDDTSVSGQVVLIAQATYVNLDVFNIQGSSNSLLYDNVNDHNPLNKNYYGWTKEYTGFKMLVRNIPKADNNGANWDSLGVLFDAAKVTHVGTVGNLGYSNQNLRGKSKLWEDAWDSARSYGLTVPETKETDGSIVLPADATNEQKEVYAKLPVWSKSGNTYIFNPNYICYTIYEEEPGQAKLYSAVGVATPAFDTNKSSMPFANLTDDTAEWYEWAGVLAGQVPQQMFYLDLSRSESSVYNGLTYFDWLNDDKSWKEYKTVSGDDKTLQYDCPTGGNTNAKQLVCKVKNYQAGKIADDKDYVYFIFSVVYENASYEGCSDNGVPDSGSIFEVSGSFDKTIKTDQFNASSKNWLVWVIVAVGIVIYAFIMYFTGPAGCTAISAMIAGTTGGTFWANVGFVLSQIPAILGGVAVNFFKQSFAITALKGTIKTIAVIAAFIYISGVITNGAISEFTYLSQIDRDLGFLGNAYSHEIIYSDGKVVYSVDDIYQDKYASYVFCSFERPNDYLQSPYLGFCIGGVNDGYIDEVNYSGDSSTIKLKIKDDNNLDYTVFTQGVDTFTQVVECQDITNYLGSGAEEALYLKLGYNEMTQKYYYLAPLYTYAEGCYWININSGEVGYYSVGSMNYSPTSYQTTDDQGKTVTKERSELPYVINENNHTYEYGTFDDMSATSPYVISGSNGNLIEINDLSNDSEKYIIHEDIEKYKTTFSKEDVENVRTLSYVKVNNLNTENKILGYDYFEGIYYTAQGDVFSTKDYKYATFEFKGNTAGSVTGKENIDYYVEYNIHTGNYIQSSTGAYYKDGEEYKLIPNDMDVPAENRYKKELINKFYQIRLDIPMDDATTTVVNNCIKVKVYPYSFVNPYKDNADLAKSNLKDTNMYAYSPSGNIVAKVTFFLFEGGYIIDEQDNVYTLVKNEVLGVANEDDGSVSDLTTYGQGVQLFDGKGNTIYKNAEAKENYTYQDIIDNPAKFADYYIININVNDLTVEEKKAAESYKVSVAFKVKDSKIYTLNSSYVVSTDEGSRGLLQKMYLKFTHTENESFIINKYRSNSSVELYTHYKYNFNFDDGVNRKYLTEVWKKIDNAPGEDDKWNYSFVDSSYRLIPEKYENYNGRPNSKVTVLTERVQVVLNGYNSEAVSAGSPTGSFTIK